MSALNHEQARYYLDIGREQLTGQEQTRLDSHLAGCVACCRYAEDLAAFQGRLVEMMHARWDGYSPDPAVKVQVQARLRRRLQPKQWFNFAASAAAAATLVGLIVLLSWLAWRTRPLPARLATPALAPTVVHQSPAPTSGDWPVLPGLATFGDTVRLLGFSLASDSLNPNDMAEITLYWQLRPSTATYSVFLHLLDADQQIWSQVDRPLSGECQTTQGEFTPGLWAGCYALPVAAPPGTYRLAVGIYDEADGQRLTTETGQAELVLTTIQVGTLPTETPLLSPTPTPTPFPMPANCPVTLPNGSTPPGEEPIPDHHGNDALWTTLWPEGKVLIPPQMVQPDGSLAMKWGWWRGVEGQLSVEGRRLDTLLAPPLRAEIAEGYGNTGFQGGGLIFPSEGCWEVTGKVGEAELTFVVFVVKVDELP